MFAFCLYGQDLGGRMLSSHQIPSFYLKPNFIVVALSGVCLFAQIYIEKAKSPCPVTFLDLHRTPSAERICRIFNQLAMSSKLPIPYRLTDYDSFFGSQKSKYLASSFKGLSFLTTISIVKVLLTSPKMNSHSLEICKVQAFGLRRWSCQTYVELVWGCSNASFGILRPGFLFLPVGKDGRIKLRSESQHESRDRDCSRKKGQNWERRSHFHIQNSTSYQDGCEWQAPVTRLSRASQVQTEVRDEVFHQCRVQCQYRAASPLYPGRPALFSLLGVRHSNFFFIFLYTTMVMVDGVSYRVVSFIMSVRCTHTSLSIP